MAVTAGRRPAPATSPDRAGEALVPIASAAAVPVVTAAAPIGPVPLLFSYRNLEEGE